MRRPSANKKLLKMCFPSSIFAANKKVWCFFRSLGFWSPPPIFLRSRPERGGMYHIFVLKFIAQVDDT